MNELRELTLEQWETEGAKRFGADKLDWKFVCPCCGYVASVREWQEAGAAQMAAFSCIGRSMKEKREAFGGKGPGPCNYAGGGFFKLNPVKVGDGESRIFEFAPA